MVGVGVELCEAEDVGRVDIDTRIDRHFGALCSAALPSLPASPRPPVLTLEIQCSSHTYYTLSNSV